MALDETIALLKGAPIIGLFERDALRLLAFSAETRRLRSGEILFRKGERSDGGYVVVAGQVGLVARGGDPEIAVGPGSLIGRVALFVRLQRPATATARESCELLRISPTLMRRVLGEFPSAAAFMQTAMADDLDDLSAGLDRVRQTMLAIAR